MSTFDLICHMKNGTINTFHNVDRREHPNLLEFIKLKELVVRNQKVAEQSAASETAKQSERQRKALEEVVGDVEEEDEGTDVDEDFAPKVETSGDEDNGGSDLESEGKLDSEEEESEPDDEDDLIEDDMPKKKKS